MPINGMIVKKNATSGTTVGGTSMTLSSDGQEVKNGIHVADLAEANFLVRTNLSLRTRNPQKQADGSYSKGKRFQTWVVPKLISDGTIVYNLVRNEIEAHPETTVAELTNLYMLGAQGYTDVNLQSFLIYGSLL